MGVGRVVAAEERWRQEALGAEHAALFAYGRLGVLLDPDKRAEALAAEAEHRRRRDALLIELDQMKATPEPAAAAYQLPFAVNDAQNAMRLAVHVEDGVAGAWREAVGVAGGEGRRVVLDAYTDAAIRATRWRRMAGVEPATNPYPGRMR